MNEVVGQCRDEAVHWLQSCKGSGSSCRRFARIRWSAMPSSRLQVVEGCRCHPACDGPLHLPDRAVRLGRAFDHRHHHPRRQHRVADRHGRRCAAAQWSRWWIERHVWRRWNHRSRLCRSRTKSQSDHRRDRSRMVVHGGGARHVPRVARFGAR